MMNTENNERYVIMINNKFYKEKEKGEYTLVLDKEQATLYNMNKAFKKQKKLLKKFSNVYILSL